jgi:hypothetical protein
MKNKNGTTSNHQDSTINTVNISTKNIRAVKRLKVLVHFLYNPQGVTEKSINRAAHVMSGRNYPTQLQRQHNIILANRIERVKDKEGCYYSVYRLKNKEQAHKLVDLIIRHCQHYKLACPDELGMRLLADNFPNRGEVAA